MHQSQIIVTDFRVNTTEDDPNSFFYVTKLVNLENPGTSIQVLFDAYISQVNDVRVLFATGQRVPVDQTVFIPFLDMETLVLMEKS